MYDLSLRPDGVATDGTARHNFPDLFPSAMADGKGLLGRQAIRVVFWQGIEIPLLGSSDRVAAWSFGMVVAMMKANCGPKSPKPSFRGFFFREKDGSDQGSGVRMVYFYYVYIFNNLFIKYINIAHNRSRLIF